MNNFLFFEWQSSPKKHSSILKKHICKNIWKKQGYWTALKAFSLAKSFSTGNSKIFFCTTNN